MGVEFTLVCDELREFVDPHAIEAQLGKSSQIVADGSRFGALAMSLMCGRWSGSSARLVSEFDSDDYRDVSLEAIEQFNSEEVPRCAACRAVAAGSDARGFNTCGAAGCPPAVERWTPRTTEIAPRANYESEMLDEDDDEDDDPPPRHRGKRVALEARLAYEVELSAGSRVAAMPSRGQVFRGGPEEPASDVPPEKLRDFQVEEVAVFRREGNSLNQWGLGDDDPLVVLRGTPVGARWCLRDRLSVSRKPEPHFNVTTTEIDVVNRRAEPIAVLVELRGRAFVEE